MTPIGLRALKATRIGRRAFLGGVAISPLAPSASWAGHQTDMQFVGNAKTRVLTISEVVLLPRQDTADQPAAIYMRGPSLARWDLYLDGFGPDATYQIVMRADGSVNAGRIPGQWGGVKAGHC